MSFFNKQILRVGVKVAMAFLFTGSVHAGDPKGGVEGPGPGGPKEDNVLQEAPLPDLEFVTFRIKEESEPVTPSVDPWNYHPGDKITLKGEIRNIGKASSPQYSVAYVLRKIESVDPLLNPSPLPVMHVSSSYGLGLGPGAKAGLGPLGIHAFTLPSQMPVGKWYVEARIDPQNTILEEEKENNRQVIGIVKVNPPKSKPGATPGGGYGFVTPTDFGGVTGNEARAQAIARGLGARQGVPATPGVILHRPATVAAPGLRMRPDARAMTPFNLPANVNVNGPVNAGMVPARGRAVMGPQGQFFR